MSLTDATRERLAGVATATLATALFKRGLRNQTIQDVRPLSTSPVGRNMVGPAYTLRFIPAREDLSVLESFTDPDHPQRRAVEACPPGGVLVIDSRREARAASAGGILVARLQHRGCAGIVTDGGFRDSPEIAELGFPAYHARPSAPMTLTKHLAVAAQEPIGCGEVAVFPGDVIVGDAEAAVVVPAHLADDVAAEAVEMTLFEDFVMEEVRAGAAVIGLYPPTNPETLEKFAAWRARRGA